MNEQLDASVDTSEDVVLPGQLAQSESVETPSESSPDSGDNHEQKHDGVQARFNKLTAEKYQAQREKDDLQRQLDELKSKPSAPVQDATPQVDTSAPKLPEDIYDEEAMRKYYAESEKYNRSIAQEAVKTTYESQKKAESEQAAKAKQAEFISAYANNAVRDGVDVEKLRVAEQAINQAGINPQLAEYIMKDANGGKIVETLYDNPSLMHELLAMDPISAGMKIAQEVKPMALSKTPKVSSAPTPPTEIKGGGVHEQDEFERKYPGAQFI